MSEISGKSAQYPQDRTARLSRLAALLDIFETVCRGIFLANARQKGTHCDPRVRDVIHAQPAACKLEQRRE